MREPNETIGTCEICGATDHHLAEGVCPSCRPRCVTVTVCPRHGNLGEQLLAGFKAAAMAGLAVCNLGTPEDDVPGEAATAPSLARGPRLDPIGAAAEPSAAPARRMHLVRLGDAA